MDATSDNCYTDEKTFTEQTGEHYMRARWYVATGINAFAYVTVITFRDSSSNFVALLYVKEDGSELDVSICDEAETCIAEEGVTKDNWHTVVWHHTNDGSVDMEYQIDGGSTTTITNATNPTNDADRWFAGEAAASSDASIFVDDIGVCQVAANCGWIP
jgi:hypothetical protein